MPHSRNSNSIFADARECFDPASRRFAWQQRHISRAFFGPWLARSNSFLPAEAPLEMPVQTLRQESSLTAGPVPLGAAPNIGHRRLFMVFGSLALGAIAAQQTLAALSADGIDGLDIVFIALFFSLFAWISFGFLGALAGFAALLGDSTVEASASPPRLPRQRTAVLLTICNEDLAAVSKRLNTMTSSIASIKAAPLFDFFVLSDSDAKAEETEIAVFRGVRERSAANVFYRRRTRNDARKPGNIADWVRRFGAAYTAMIVLDADSLMSGDAMVQLATSLEDQPAVGLLQTIPAIIEGHTFFARWHQFAAAAYGLVASAGLQWWSGSEATYWGHNAIVRVQAFAESCGLPSLSGAEPFGGSIMSHDMVEAALLRRRGWAVQMVTLPGGSYEEFPPTLADHAIRDRRWCQGNLQHLRLLGTGGLHWVSRLQLLMGASSYLTSPLWLSLLLVGFAEQTRASGLGVAALPQPWLLGLTGLMLLGPKIIALLWLGIDRDLRNRLGGGRRVVATIAIEIPLSMLVAPIIMLGQTMAIVDILRGRPSGWLAQRRKADGLSLPDALYLYSWHMALGMGFLLAAIGGPRCAIWTMPVTLCLLAAPITAMLVSRQDVGKWLRRHRLFGSPNDLPATMGRSRFWSTKPTTC